MENIPAGLLSSVQFSKRTDVYMIQIDLLKMDQAIPLQAHYVGLQVQNNKPLEIQQHHHLEVYDRIDTLNAIGEHEFSSVQV